MKYPKVSVIMPVYNGEKYLGEAITSILEQDFKDFEFIIINDGSTDNSERIISGFNDPRIKVVVNEKNNGLVRSLNSAIEIAKGEYLVRMDADDVSLKNRLSIQVDHMDKHKKVGACGSFYFMLYGNKSRLTDLPVSNDEIKTFLLFNSPIAHPTAMIRKKVLLDNGISYSSEYSHAEDYYLWTLLSKVTELSNIPKPLLKYRVHPEQITNTKDFSDVKSENVNKIRSFHLTDAKIPFSKENLKIHQLISDGLKPGSKEMLQQCGDWLNGIVLSNVKTGYYDFNYLQKIVLERWMRICVKFYGLKKGSVFFYRSDLYRNSTLPLKLKLQLARSFYYSWKRNNIKKD